MRFDSFICEWSWSWQILKEQAVLVDRRKNPTRVIAWILDFGFVQCLQFLFYFKICWWYFLSLKTSKTLKQQIFYNCLILCMIVAWLCNYGYYCNYCNMSRKQLLGIIWIIVLRVCICNPRFRTTYYSIDKGNCTCR